MIKEPDVAIFGAGPAGLNAAITAASLGANVTLIDRQNRLGGQLIKQSHKFFGSERLYASVRGIDIANILSQKVKDKENIEVFLETVVLSYCKDGTVILEQKNQNGENTLVQIKPQSTVIATGAFEKVLAFPNCDLPGIYGAGAVQTLMNVDGVKPGEKAALVGAGNIGLIVAYQLLQAGVNVVAIIEALPNIGGYAVHASKIIRMGIPILTSHTIKEAYGRETLEGIKIVQINNKWEEIQGSERDLKIDTLCISVGLSPLSELLWQAGCEMCFIPELGGYVAVRDETLETSKDGIFIAGDVAEIEEATSAMLEGIISGYYAAKKVGYVDKNDIVPIKDIKKELEILRESPSALHIKKGLKHLIKESEVFFPC